MGSCVACVVCFGRRAVAVGGRGGGGGDLVEEQIWCTPAKGGRAASGNRRGFGLSWTVQSQPSPAKVVGILCVDGVGVKRRVKLESPSLTLET